MAEMASSPATVLFVARDEGRIVGSLTLAVFRAPDGVARLDRRRRRRLVRSAARGVGGTLVREALERAASMGARTVDLTSRPSRVEANRLYLQLGFEARETNVYRFNADA